MIKVYDECFGHVSLFIYFFFFSCVCTKMSKTCCDAVRKTSQFHKGF